jgi:hypothetical protein
MVILIVENYVSLFLFINGKLQKSTIVDEKLLKKSSDSAEKPE